MGLKVIKGPISLGACDGFAVEGDEPFDAYNDLSWTSGQRAQNITLYTTDNGTGVPPQGSSGHLVDFNTGLEIPVKLSVTGGLWNGAFHAKKGRVPRTNTPGRNFFRNKVDLRGIINYAQEDVVLSFEGCNPNMLYEVVVFGNRNRASYVNRFTEYIISGAKKFTNDSSPGSDFDGPNDNSTVIANGWNRNEGYVGRFRDVDAGLDGKFDVLVTSPEGESQRYYVSSVYVRAYRPDTLCDAAEIVHRDTEKPFFGMPFDHVGEKSAPEYEEYAKQFIHDIELPYCDVPGNARVFVGQRKESFAVNLGETFDLVNINNPIGNRDAEENSLEGKNITTIALEIPIECLTEGNADVIGAWTTASLPRFGIRTLLTTFEQPEFNFGDIVQISRLGGPLVNELAIGLPDKNRFSASHPSNDGQFLHYVTHPTLPELFDLLLPITAPNFFPRSDLVEFFASGIVGLNDNGSTAEMLRLNTSTSVTSEGSQESLGWLNGDDAGYPNGRRPGDDVVDIILRVMMGVQLSTTVAPSGQLPYTDGAEQNASQFDSEFPYLTTPIPGSPN